MNWLIFFVYMPRVYNGNIIMETYQISSFTAIFVCQALMFIVFFFTSQW